MQKERVQEPKSGRSQEDGVQWTRLRTTKSPKRLGRAQMGMRNGEQPSVTKKPCTCLPQRLVESGTTLGGGHWMRNVFSRQDLVLGAIPVQMLRWQPEESQWQPPGNLAEDSGGSEGG